MSKIGLEEMKQTMEKQLKNSMATNYETLTTTYGPVSGTSTGTWVTPTMGGWIHPSPSGPPLIDDPLSGVSKIELETLRRQMLELTLLCEKMAETIKELKEQVKNRI